MYHIQWQKIILYSLFILNVFAVTAQENNYKRYETKQYYFGITLGINRNDFKISRSSDFTYNDSIDAIIALRRPGFHLNIITNLSMTKTLDLRFNPGLSFTERALNYTLYREKIVEKKLESVNLDFPFQIRYKSQPIGDAKFYALLGVKYSIDLASNSQARKSRNIIKLNRSDYGIEYGLGVQIFFPYFVLSPEFKVSQGVNNVLFRDARLGYSSALDGLRTRMFSFSLHFEG